MENGLIKKLSNDTGCDIITSQLLLQFTGGDLDGAKKILDSMAKNLVVIKAKFIAQKTSYYGTTIIIFDRQKNSLERIEIALGHDIEFTKANIESQWYEILDYISELQKSKKHIKDISDRIEQNIRSDEFYPDFKEILNSTEEVNNERVKIFLSDLLFKVTSDTAITIKLKTSRINAFQLYKTKSDNTQEENLADKQEHTQDSNPVEQGERLDHDKPLPAEHGLSFIVLQTDVEVAPVNGIPVTDLQPGDEIMIRVTDNREIASYLNKLLCGNDENIRLPIKARIKEINSSTETGSIMIVQEFGPGIMGRSFVQNDVKIETPFSDQIAEIKKMEGTPNIKPIWIIILLLVIFIIFVLVTVLTK